MTAIILSILSWAWPYIAGALGLLALVFQQRRAGAKAEKAKQAERDASAIKQHKEIRDETGRLEELAAQLEAMNEAPRRRRGNQS